MVSSWSVKQPTEYRTMTRKDSNRTAKEIKAMIAGDGEFLRPMVKAVNQEFLEAEMAQAVGAEKGERAEGRFELPKRLLHAQLDYPSRATSTVSSPRSVLIATERSTAPPTRDCFGVPSALESLDTRVLFFQPSWPLDFANVQPSVFSFSLVLHGRANIVRPRSDSTLYLLSCSCAELQLPRDFFWSSPLSRNDAPDPPSARWDYLR